MDAATLEARLGYRFNASQLLRQALTHRSHSAPHNERLEFLGDSVLGFVIAQDLFGRFAAHQEGKLTRIRASLVREQTLADLAQKLELGDCLYLGEGEVKTGGRQRVSILADALEAVFGAVLLDGGVDAARAVILRVYQPLLAAIDPGVEVKDAKTRLQELLQGRRQPLPKYSVIATVGTAPNEVFEVECVVASAGLRTVGAGGTRRRAEQEAARAAFEQLSAAASGKGAS